MDTDLITSCPGFAYFASAPTRMKPILSKLISTNKRRLTMKESERAYDIQAAKQEARGKIVK
eukprot:755698-Hanusia_phi.AAC.1